jgi:hypothetical protein
MTTGNSTTPAGALVSAQSSAPFDYSEMPLADRAGLQQAADRLRSKIEALHGMMRDAEARVNRDAAAIGAELLRVKARLPHGTFTAWCRAELALEPRSSQNYMRAADAVQAAPDAIRETVSRLPQRTLYALGAAPSPIRDAVLDQLATGAVKPDDVKATLDAAGEAARAAAKAEKMTPEARRKNKLIARARVRREADRARQMERDKAAGEAERIARTEAARSLAKLLVSALDEAQRIRAAELLTASGWGLAEALKAELTGCAA